MRMTGAATRQVVDRCPRCGVEHEGDGVHECEACGSALRSWCRAHSREIAWLDRRACARCAEDAARPPAATLAPPAPLRSTAPAPTAAVETRPTPPPASPPAHVLFPGGTPPGRPLREVIGERRPPAEGAGGGADNGALVGGILLVILGIAAGGLLGVLGGIISLSAAGGGEDALVTWALGGAVLGLLAGLGVALAAVAQTSRRE